MVSCYKKLTIKATIAKQQKYYNKDTQNFYSFIIEVGSVTNWPVALILLVKKLIYNFTIN